MTNEGSVQPGGDVQNSVVPGGVLGSLQGLLEQLHALVQHLDPAAIQGRVDQTLGQVGEVLALVQRVDGQVTTAIALLQRIDAALEGNTPPPVGPAPPPVAGMPEPPAT